MAPDGAGAPRSRSADADSSDDSSDEEDIGDTAAGGLMKNCVGVPGLMHILHNLSLHVSSSMEHWEEFYDQLQNIDMLLSTPYRRRLLVDTCIRGTSYRHAEADFLAGTPQLYEKRWSVVQQFLVKAKPLLLMLRVAWQQQAFDESARSANNDEDQDQDCHHDDGEETSGRGRAFSSAMLSKTLRSNFFFAYMSMCMQVHGVISSACGWAEGCECHDIFLQGVSRHFRAKAMAADFGKHTTTCPLQGMRLPELVADMHDKILKSAADCNFAELLEDTAGWCAPAEWQVVARDFHAAAAHLQFEFKLKMHFTQTLPWSLAALAHHDQAVARRCAKQAMDVYDNMAPHLREHVHRKAKRFLDPQRGLRSEIAKFCDGADRSSLSLRARRSIATFRFMSIAERIVESSHKDVKKSAGYDRAGPVAVSLSVRTSVVLEGPLLRGSSVNTAADYIDGIGSVVRQVEVARRPQDIIRRLHLSRHPDMAHLQQQQLCRGPGRPRLQYSEWYTKLAQIVYRCDLESHHTAFQGQEKSHKSMAAKAKRDIAKLTQEKAPKLSGGAVLAFHMVQHIRETVDEGAVVSLPCGAWNLTNLRESLAQQPRIASEKPPAQALPRRDCEREDGNCVGPVRLDGDPEALEGLATQAANGSLSGSRLFKIVHKHPRRVKTIPLGVLGSSSRVHDQALAVTPMPLIAEAEDGIHVRLLGNNRNVELALAGPFTHADVELFRGSGRAHGAYAWQPAAGTSGGHALYALHGFCTPDHDHDSQDVAELVSKPLREMLAHRAIVGAPPPCTSWRLHESDPCTPVLMQMLTGGFVCLERSAGGWNLWRLTQHGLRGIEFTTHLHKPLPLCDVRESVALKDATIFELLLRLQDNGWTWQALPKIKAARGDIEPYRLGGPKVWRTAGHTVLASYLQCLLQAKELKDKHGVDAIPHGQFELVYKRLLQGKKWDALASIEDAQLRRRQPLAVDVGEGDSDQGEQPALHDAPPINDDVPHEGGSAGQPGSSDDDCDPGEGGANLAIEPALGRAEAPEAGPASVHHDAHGRAVLDMRGSWGCFKFSVYPPGPSGGRFGVLQAVCPWHARSSVSGCKKSISIADRTAAARDEAMRMAKFWCVQASRFERQWEHVFAADVIGPAPSDHTLESMRLDEGPRPGSVEDDTTFYNKSAGSDRGSVRRQRRNRKASADEGQQALPASASNSELQPDADSLEPRPKRRKRAEAAGLIIQLTIKTILFIYTVLNTIY